MIRIPYTKAIADSNVKHFPKDPKDNCVAWHNRYARLHGQIPPLKLARMAGFYSVRTKQWVNKEPYHEWLIANLQEESYLVYDVFDSLEVFFSDENEALMFKLATSDMAHE